MGLRRVIFLFVPLVLAGCPARERASSSGSDASPEAAPLASAGAPASASEALEFGPVAPPAPSVAPILAAEWVWKTYRGDHFSALFPGDPKLKVLPPEEDRVGYTEASFDVPGGQVSFAVGFTDHSQADVAKPDAFLDEKANAPRRGFTDILHKRAITLPGGQPGRVLILRRNISGTPLRVYSRLYLVGRRLYSLIVSTLDVGGVSEDVVKKFMESFKLG